MKKGKLLITLLPFVLISCGGASSSLKITDSDKTLPNQVNPNFDYDDMLSEDFDESRYYRNDLDKVNLPDPYVFYDEDSGNYYIYGTTDRTGGKCLDCYETKDFNNFKVYQKIDVQKSTYWDMGTNHSRFAPEVYKFDDTYYLYYSDVDASGTRYINVMTSEHPYGPFEEWEDGEEPCFKNDIDLYSVLDQTIFEDVDGELYMFYSVYQTGVMQYIVGMHMLSPTEVDWNTYKIVVRPGEINTSTTASNILKWEAYQKFKVAEGPAVIYSPVNGKYYLTYSVNHYPDKSYSVCYAEADEILGEYVKPFVKDQLWTNLLFGYAGAPSGTVYDQWDGFMSGTGHHCFFKVGDQYMIGYHAHKSRRENSLRAFGMDYVYFDKVTGVPYTQGPTYSIQPLPEAISGMKNLTQLSSTKYVTSGISNPERLFDNYVVEHYQLSQEANKEATLSTGNNYVKIKFDKKYYISSVFIYQSAFYDYYDESRIGFINFGDNNFIKDGRYNENSYLNDETSFIFPTSAYTFDILSDVYTDTVVINLPATYNCRLNEIMVLGGETSYAS